MPMTANLSPQQQLQTAFERSGLLALELQGRRLLPIVQGGMGVGVSAQQLAGTVASLGGVGTLSSVDLRRLHPDLMARTEGHCAGDAAKRLINEVNLIALEREIAGAKQRAQGRGLVALNVMRAVAEYAPQVRRALECGIEAVVVGAGLPLDLPDLAAAYPRVALIPILSDARGVQLIVRKWERKQRLPDAIVIEHPRLAGGHLGAAKVSDVNDARFDFERVIPECLEYFEKAGIAGKIPLIAAGGVRTFEDIQRLQALGAAAVQLGTPFAVTLEGDAHPEFKRVLAEASDTDLVEFISVAGLPARAVATPWLRNYLRAAPKLQAMAQVKSRCTKAFDCLAQCGLRDGLKEAGQFCIDNQLAAALRGDAKHGLFFRGVGALPFGSQIRSVAELMQCLMSPGAGRAAQGV